jgi:hypothetical protein
MTADFTEFPKMARWSRDVIVTEKIDGTNAQVFIADDGSMLFGSRTRWITPQDDNQGFAAWATENREGLLGLGPGRHFGEWWGAGIQRRYGLTEKRFSLFNVGRWYDPKDCEGEEIEGRTAVPACCRVVPILAKGPQAPGLIEHCIDLLRQRGSLAAPGFMDPEGVVLFHIAAGIGFKKTLKKDEVPKTLANRSIAA